MAPPRYATPRPTGPTHGVAITKILEALQGAPALPWQEYSADVIGEVLPNGLPRWKMIIVTVPRQAGKTSLTMATAVHRILTLRNARCWYTAQTGQDAADQWRENVTHLEASPLHPLFSIRRANGSQVLRSPATDGRFSPIPPTEDKMHGKQSDIMFIDEAWAFPEVQAVPLMGAIVPTQTTRPYAQIIITSTMGTHNSSWFHSLVDRARAGDPDIALLDWGISPTDDPTDLDVVAAAHPAYGYTLTMDKLRDAYAALGNPAEFARAYGNRPTGALERLIPLEAWQAAQSDTDTIPAEAPICLGVAVDMDRTQGVIAAGWADANSVPHLEIIDCRPGTGWIIERLTALAAGHKILSVTIDAVGPAGSIADTLDRKHNSTTRYALKNIGTRELTAATAEMYDKIIAGSIKIMPSKDLDLAAEIVSRRRLGDAWTWSRRGSSGSIAALEAATLAMHACLHIPAPAIAPLITF